MARKPLVGSSVRRAADEPLLKGTAEFAGDIERPGQLWARLVRSPIAHGVIRGIDASAALARPGVVRVLTGAELPDVRIPIRLPLAETSQTPELLQRPLARHRVRYVGDPVAVVVADDPYLAEDAAEEVFVDLEERDAVVNRAGPGVGEEATIHESLPTNVLEPTRLVCGDPDAVFKSADVVLSEQFYVHRHGAVPMETRGLVAEADPASGKVTVWGATKVKHFNRQALSRMLGCELDDVRLLEVNVGGGFGARGELYPEDYLIPFLAAELERPVKWVEDRSEHLVATNHAREQWHEFDLAATSDGRLLAFRDRAWVDQGAYVRTQGILPQVLVAFQVMGPYAWEAFAIEVAGALSTRTPVGTYRGPGMTEATFVREGMIDALAFRLDLDPAAIRKQNFVPSSSMPHVFDCGPDSPPLVLESGDYADAFDKLLAAGDYDRYRSENSRLQEAGGRVGLGVAAYLELSAIGPFEEARISATPDGLFTVRVGVASLGQGVETALGQIAADQLGVPFEAIEILYHDTDEVPTGFGSFASRSTVLSGNAIALAATDLREKAAAELGCDPEAVTFQGGHAAAGGDISVEIASLGMAFGKYEKEHPSYSFGAALSQVRLDDDTGQIKVEEHVISADVGRIVNPVLLDGQIVGAGAQGVSGALLEELAYDEHGQPLAASFVDYLLPTAADTPSINAVILEYPNTSNPLGVKGAGEAGIAGTPAAIAAATADALGDGAPPIRALPLTPELVVERSKT
jgi:carbon-monoxide dehydrogenase large subunit